MRFAEWKWRVAYEGTGKGFLTAAKVAADDSDKMLGEGGGKVQASGVDVRRSTKGSRTRWSLRRR